MFTVLEIENRNLHLSERIAWHFHPPKPEFYKIAVKSGAPFFVLRMQVRENIIPWDEILRTAGRCAGRVLARDDLTLPDTGLVQRFVPKFLPLTMALQTMVDIMELARIPPRLLRLGIFDPEGVLCDKCRLFLPYTGDLRICTKADSAYMAESEQLMRLYGMRMTVTESIATLKDCNVLLSGNTDDLPAKDAVRFGLCGAPCEKTFHFKSPHIPSPYCAQIPEGVDGGIFASALYELCGVRKLEECRFREILHRNEKAEQQLAIDALRDACFSS